MGEQLQQVVVEVFTQMMYIASDPIFLIAAILIIVMYQREIKGTYDKRIQTNIEATAAKDILRGIVIGSIVSVALKYLGIVIPLTAGLLVLIPITIILGMINARWVCFSYVIPMVWLVDTLLQMMGVQVIELHYGKMIMLIGMLHVIEGGLVMRYGNENTHEIPLYRDNKIIKGNVLKKFWIMPIAIFYNVGTVNVGVPIYTVIGYRDIAIGLTTKKQAIKSGIILIGYGVVVMLIGGMMARELLPYIVGITIVPLLHESMFILSKS